MEHPLRRPNSNIPQIVAAESGDTMRGGMFQRQEFSKKVVPGSKSLDNPRLKMGFFQLGGGGFDGVIGWGLLRFCYGGAWDGWDLCDLCRQGVAVGRGGRVNCSPPLLSLVGSVQIGWRLCLGLLLLFLVRVV